MNQLRVLIHCSSKGGVPRQESGWRWPPSGIQLDRKWQTAVSGAGRMGAGVQALGMCYWNAMSTVSRALGRQPTMNALLNNVRANATVMRDMLDLFAVRAMTR